MSFVRVSDTPDDGLILKRHYPPGEPTWLEIVHAQPRTLFAGELLRISADGCTSEEMQVRRGPRHNSRCPHSCVDVGDVVTIAARNRTVIYRLIQYDGGQDNFLGEWPD